MAFVKPNHIVLDARAQDEKDAALAAETSANLFHIQKQLVAHGHSLEAVIAHVARTAFGVPVVIHAPKPKADAA